MESVVMLVGLLAGLFLSVVAASKVMTRRNSRSLAILTGGIVAPFCFIVGVFAAGLFASAQELRTGGLMVLGIMAIYGTVLAAIIGALIALFVGIGMKQPSDAKWGSGDGDRRGY